VANPNRHNCNPVVIFSEAERSAVAFRSPRIRAELLASDYRQFGRSRNHSDVAF
jgi:hypothetical protein